MTDTTQIETFQTSGNDGGDYASGVCNIGADEIRARRRFGHIGLAATLGFAVLVLATHAPQLIRLLVFFPAAGAATGYLQAAFRFCAGFGMRGVYNFGRLGTTHEVADAASRSRDRRRSLQISGLSMLVGVVVAVTLYFA